MSRAAVMPIRTLLCAASLLAPAAAQEILRQPEGWPRLDADSIEETLDWVQGFVRDGAICALRDGDRAVDVVGIWDDDPIVYTKKLGRVALDNWPLDRVGLKPLIELVDATRDEPLPPPAEPPDAPDAFEHRVAFHPLLGSWLAVDGVAVTPGSRWQREVVGGLEARGRAEREAIEAALGPYDEPRLSRRLGVDAGSSFAEVLGRCALDALPDHATADDLTPERVRRMVRHGWVDDVMGRPTPLSQALADAVTTASTLRSAAIWTDGARRCHRLTNAFGREVWLLRDAGAVRVAIRAPHVEFSELDWEVPNEGWIVLEVEPSAAEPVPDLTLEDIRAATLFDSALEVARWSHDAGLVVDRATWRQEVPIDYLVENDHAAPDYLPPHVPLVDAFGDLLGVATAHGVLRPARDGSPAEVERFVSDAARLLPDAAHLDLIGQYFVVYALDSPDPDQPTVVGSGEALDDHHSTAAETVGTVKGGVCRGDCDDLAELYHDILRAQGKRAFVLDLPEHLATLWTERDGDGWRTNMVHSGLVSSFVRPTLAESLAAAVRDQDPAELFDPAEMRLSVRFGGDPIRTPVWLDHSVFTSDEQLDEQLEFERDRWRGTYGRALERCATIAPNTYARALRLAYTRAATGDHRAALDALRPQLPNLGDPATRLWATLYAAEFATAAGETAESHALVDALCRQVLGELEGVGELARMQFGIEAAYRLAECDALAVCGRVLARVAAPNLKRMCASLARRADGRQAANARDRALDEADRELVDEQLAAHAAALGTTAAFADRLDATDRIRIAIALDHWATRWAFADPDVADTVCFDACCVAQYLILVHGREAVFARLENLAAPRKSTERPSPDQPRTLDGPELQWALAAPEFWLTEVGTELLVDRPEQIDRERVRERLRQANRAVFAAAALEIGDDAERHSEAVRAHFVRGLIFDDRASLAAAATLAGLNGADGPLELLDHLGWLAPLCSAESFAHALHSLDRADIEPRHVLGLAWELLELGTAERAVDAARLAAELADGDPLFSAEIDHVRAAGRR